MRGAAEAAKKIDIYVAIEMLPRPIGEVLVDIIEAENWTTEVESAEELAEKWVQRFQFFLKKKALEESERSLISCFEFNTANEEYIQGSCFVEPSSSEEEREGKRRRANCVHVKDALSKISDQQFEVLCARVLRLMHVEDPIHTRYSMDHGIDFFGRMPIGEIIKPSAISSGAESQMKVWLVGQAKNYKSSQVSTKDVRELIGAVSLARSKTYVGQTNPFSNLNIRLCDPIFYLFFTTGSFSRDAFALFKKTGIVAMDGNQLSVFLADNNVGVVDGRFDEAAFNAWAFGDKKVDIGHAPFLWTTTLCDAATQIPR